MSDIKAALESAVQSGSLLESARDNIVEFLGITENPVYPESIAELVEGGNWKELNDRFYKKLAFGTGGLRGRTIGETVTKAEAGTPRENDRPEFPCVGTATMNYFNVSRATRGLIAYLKTYLAEKGEGGKPKLVVCHDTRHFSRELAELCAEIGKNLGVDVYLFEGFRPTPEMSFAVRQLGAQAGIMITASHNPPHDNGYKVNFADGAAIIPPQTDGIIGEVEAITSESYEAVPEAEQGTITALGADMDRVYIDRVKGMLLRPELLEGGNESKVVFTAIHGTGGFFIPDLLRELGFTCLTVPEQDIPDGRFPTVESPNPENAPALAMGKDLAEKEGADIVIGTDPDCDRMGVFVRNTAGEMTLLTGNQIGSIMAAYRVKTMFDLGILNDSNKKNAILIKTFVTTDLQKAIAEKYGIDFVNTLTGFKYIGQKLRKYEEAIPGEAHEGYLDKTEAETRDIRLQHSKFMIFGGEESYGYLACDFCRDKDGNAAALMFAESAAYAASRGITLVEYLDEIYLEFGYFLEINKSKYYEGAEGAANIAKLAASYSDNPPAEVDGAAVTGVRNFGTQDLHDEEGDLIAKEKMIFFDLADGRTFAVRPSGTEPKIKFYLFAEVKPDSFDAGSLPQVKTDTEASLERLWSWIDGDIGGRLG
ncbi:MAG: phospho-sugar mutase [Verrucomicrobiota bacterium]